jgi:thiol:disulfide interchange protein
MRVPAAVLATLFTGLVIGIPVTQAAELSTANPLPTNPLATGSSTLTRASGGGALPADEAFALNSVVEADGDVILVWEMPPSYYLYRKSLKLAHADDDLLPALELPEGTQVSDEFFGASEVYFERLLARLPAGTLQAAPGETVELELAYQGCRDNVYCYPPQYTTVSITLP